MLCSPQKPAQNPSAGNIPGLQWLCVMSGDIFCRMVMEKSKQTKLHIRSSLLLKDTFVINSTPYQQAISSFPMGTFLEKCLQYSLHYFYRKKEERHTLQYP